MSCDTVKSLSVVCKIPFLLFCLSGPLNAFNSSFPLAYAPSSTTDGPSMAFSTFVSSNSSSSKGIYEGNVLSVRMKNGRNDVKEYLKNGISQRMMNFHLNNL